MGFKVVPRGYGKIAVRADTLVSEACPPITKPHNAHHLALFRIGNTFMHIAKKVMRGEKIIKKSCVEI